MRLVMWEAKAVGSLARKTTNDHSEFCVAR